MTSLSDRVQNSIVDALNAWNYPLVTYPSGRRTTGVATAKPAECLVRDASGTFITPRSNRMKGGIRERGEWLWLATVQFARPVSLESFEESMIDFPIRLSPDGDSSHHVVIELLGAEYDHPAENQPSGGVRAILRFNASLSPI